LKGGDAYALVKGLASGRKMLAKNKKQRRNNGTKAIKTIHFLRPVRRAYGRTQRRGKRQVTKVYMRVYVHGRTTKRAYRQEVNLPLGQHNRLPRRGQTGAVKRQNGKEFK